MWKKPNTLYSTFIFVKIITVLAPHFDFEYAPVLNCSNSRGIEGCF